MQARRGVAALLMRQAHGQAAEQRTPAACQALGSLTTAAGEHGGRSSSPAALPPAPAGASSAHAPAGPWHASSRDPLPHWPSWASYSTGAGPGAGSSPGADGGQEGGDGGDGAGPAPAGSSLQASMDKLVDAAVELVEAGNVLQAVQVLEQGMEALAAAYPGAPELGELHNQAALLLLFADKPDEAASHAQAALEQTQAAFGATHPLTGHRLLRLGTIRFGQGRASEARPLLGTAADMLAAAHRGPAGPQAASQDPALAEARFYLALAELAGEEDPGAFLRSEQPLARELRGMAMALGADSMIVRLALHQHSRLVNAALDREFRLGEAGFKQHMRLQEVVDPGGSAEAALTAYQLAVLYYAQDMLPDAGAMVQRAATALRQHFPEDHDLLALCKHRMGMICAAGRDHRAATTLLEASRAHYGAQQADHPLALEAALGLAMAEFKALDPRLSGVDRAARQAALLADMRAQAQALAAGLGAGHMLVKGAGRYLAQLAVMSGLGGS